MQRTNLTSQEPRLERSFPQPLTKQKPPQDSQIGQDGSNDPAQDTGATEQEEIPSELRKGSQLRTTPTASAVGALKQGRTAGNTIHNKCCGALKQGRTAGNTIHNKCCGSPGAGETVATSTTQREVVLGTQRTATQRERARSQACPTEAT